MKIIRIFISFILALIISVLILPLRSISFPLSTITGFFTFYILSICLEYIYREKLSRVQLFLSILVGGTIVQVIIRIVYYYADTLGSLPDFVLTVLGIVFAYISLYLSRTGKIIIFLVGVSLCSFMYIRGYDLWFNWLNYGTPNGRIVKPVNTVYDNFRIQNQYGDTLSLTDFNSTYLIIDFWQTHCGVCYEKMPKVQALYERYKNNSEVKIISIHARWDKEEETVASGMEILKKENYSIPCYSIDIKDTLLHSLGVDGYPTVLMFNIKNKELIFRGNIEWSGKYIEELIKL